MIVVVEEGLDIPLRPGWRTVPRRMIPGLVMEALSQGRKILAVYRGAWSEAQDLWAAVRREGYNHLLYRPLDPREAALARVPLEVMVSAWASAHAASRTHLARRGITRRTRVSRRILFMLPRGATVWHEAPVLVSPEACMGERHCRLCIESCPAGALQGKPPSLDLEACTSCGRCVAFCPYGLLENPWAGPDSMEYLLDVLGRVMEGPGFLVFTCRGAYSMLLDRLAHNPPAAPVVMVDVACPGWAGPRQVYQALARHLHPVIYCTCKEKTACGWEPIRPPLGVPWDYIVDDPGRLMKLLSRGPATRRIEQKAKGAPALLASIMEAYGVGETRLAAPLAGMVRVDQERCMLCDACSSVCKFQALRLEHDGGVTRLVFDHSRCTACGACVAACPHDAITLEWAVNPGLIGRRVVLAEGEVARCRRCGRPLGSMRMVRMVVDTMRRHGVPEWALEQAWLCPSCKLHGLPRGERG